MSEDTKNPTGKEEAVMPEINKEELSEEVREYVDSLEKAVVDADEVIKSKDEEIEELVAKADPKVDPNSPHKFAPSEDDDKTCSLCRKELGNAMHKDEKKENPFAKSKEEQKPEEKPVEKSAEELMKELPEPLRKRFEEIESQNKEAMEQLAKAREEKELEEAVKKASAWHRLGINAEEFAPVLRELTQKAPEAIAKVEEIFNTADARIKESSVFSELGKSFNGPVGGDATGKLEAMARERMTKAESGLTFEQAYAEVLGTPEGKQLYAEYSNNKR